MPPSIVSEVMCANDNACLKKLQEMASIGNCDTFSPEFAAVLDREDALASLRQEFHIPKHMDEPCVYLVGNSLGLQPVGVKNLIEQELEVWANNGHEGHFKHPYGRPWVTVDEECTDLLLPIVGAIKGEVAVMASLTANLHLLLCAFYHPTSKRFKICLEGMAFPSDHYLIESQLRLHGLDPVEAMVMINPREGEETLQTVDIITTLREHGDSVALVLFSGVHYYTGQFFDIETITRIGHEIGAYVGFDLAHATGNVPLYLHEWGVDFAAWCSYKYLNAGPGAIAGIFVHNKHDENDKLTILRGWWGHKLSTRFLMNNRFEGIPGAKGFQLSNPDVFSVTALLASLYIFAKSTMEQVRNKSLMLNCYLRLLLTPLTEGPNPKIKFITPIERDACGAQLSIRILGKTCVQKFSQRCHDQGLMVDYREPGVIRLATVALYVTFNDILRAATIIEGLLKHF